MLNSSVALLILLCALSVSGYCPNWVVTQFTAETYQKSISFDDWTYSNDWDCTFDITPDQKSSYFLQMSWESFDVKGNMPNCDEDYVEIFLTSTYKSIGKFCSGKTSATTPFKMYSHDGYAKIKFHSNNANTGKGFKLNFKLRDISTDYLDEYNLCSNSYFYGTTASGTLCSTYWPKEYDKSYTDQTFSIYPYSKKKTKLVFMDLDLAQPSLFCSTSSSDYIEVRGSDSPGYYGASVVKSAVCDNDYPVTITTSYDYVFVKFSREYGTSYSNRKRGFVAGYIIYDEESISTAVIVGLSLGSIVFCITIGFIIYCCCCRRSSKSGHVINPSHAPERAATITTTVTPDYHGPAPGYHAPLPGYHAPAPGYHAPLPEATYMQQPPLPGAPPPYTLMPGRQYTTMNNPEVPSEPLYQSSSGTASYPPPHPISSDSNAYSNPPPPDSLNTPLLR